MNYIPINHLRKILYEKFIFIILLLYFETVFQILIYGKLTELSIIPLLFAIGYGGLIQYLFSKLRYRPYKIISCIVIIGVSLIYMVQFFYYKIFHTYLSLYSLGAVGFNVAQFYRIILETIVRYLPSFLILLIPCLFLSIRVLSIKEKHDYRQTYIYIVILGMAFGFISIFLFMSRLEQNSSYQLLYHEFAMDKGVKKLGLLTSVGKNALETISPPKERPLIVEDGYKELTISTANNSNDSKHDNNMNLMGQNVLPIDFKELASTESNENLRVLNEYFSTEVPSDKNKYTGMFEGYNLILITAESFSPYAINEEITPTLYRLVNEGFVFSNFYTPLWWASTIDGEFVATSSILPKQGVISFNKIAANSLPYALGNQMKSLGYKVNAYHDHDYKYYKRDISHPNMGYEYQGIGNGLVLEDVWPASDLEMMEVTSPEYMDNIPFHTYYMTVSGHMNYNFSSNQMSIRHQEAVKELPYSKEAKAYLACNIELDLALGKLIEELESRGIADKTVIALSADHYPYALSKKAIDELAGHEVESNFELYKNHFIIWSKSMKEPIVIDKASSSLDIVPTLSNLFGLSYDSRLFMGRDILSDANPLVIFSNDSFITDKIAYNGDNNQVLYITEDAVGADYIAHMKQVVKNKFLVSGRIVQEDYYRYIEQNYEK